MMAPPKGFIPWNKGKTGIYSKEVLESNRKKHLGKKLSKEHKSKIAIKMQQRKLSEEHKRKIGESNKISQKGNNYYKQHGIIGAMERIAKISSNNWAKKNKGNFPRETLEKKRQNVSGEKNPMYGIRGEAHPSWQGGLKLLPYDKRFNKWFKDEIRIRDSFSCIKCNMFNEDHKLLFKNQQLQIHHIDYNKENTIKENCCAVCCRCNAEANFNRRYWTKFYQSLMSERHGYRYTINGEAIINIQKEDI